MTGEGQEKGRDAMTAEELAAENGRLEEDLRKAHEMMERIAKERDTERCKHRAENAALKTTIEQLESRIIKSVKPVVEIDFPGLMRIKLTGVDATCSLKEKEASKDGGR